MTCVIAVIDKETNKVFMGCDSGVQENWTMLQIKQPKMIKLNDMLIGISGTLRPLQLIQHQLVLADRTEKQSSMEYLVKVFVPAVKQLLVDNDCIMNNDNYKQSDSNLLIGYRGEIFIMDTNFQIVQTNDSYSAIGSGTDTALGALAVFSNMDWMEFSPSYTIKKTLEIAEKHCLGIQKPFKVMSI